MNTKIKQVSYTFDVSCNKNPLINGDWVVSWEYNDNGGSIIGEEYIKKYCVEFLNGCNESVYAFATDLVCSKKNSLSMLKDILKKQKS